VCVCVCVCVCDVGSSALAASRLAILALAELLLKLNGPTDALMSGLDDRALDCSRRQWMFSEFPSGARWRRIPARTCLSPVSPAELGHPVHTKHPISGGCRSKKKVQRLLKIAIVSYRRRCAVNRLLYFVVISGCWSINADGEHSYNSVVVVAVICLHWTQKNRYSMSHRPLQQYFPPVALNSDLWLRSTNMTQMGSRWTIVSNI